MTAILFVCSGNTCRSVMAEAFARRKFGDTVDVASAGIAPQKPEDAANAIHVLKTYFNVDASGHIPRNVRTVNLADYDVVVTMDAGAARQLQALSITKLIRWKIDDPWKGDDEEYRTTARQILRALGTLPIHQTGPTT